MYMEYVDDADPGPASRRGWRILGWVSIALSAVMVLTSLGAYAAYRKVLGNIKHEDINAQVGPNRPKKLNSALNILLLGSDTRDGANGKYGRSLQGEAPRSDTMILLHLSPGGGQAMGISFPRDLVVPIPPCRRKDGTSTQPQAAGQINASFTLGGAACTIKTIEGISNLRIDHFMQVDFTGFKNVVDAVGGVEICLPKAVNDPKSKLVMSKGRHVVKGETALAYVRTRHGLGDGSDLSRIKRQQQFMGSVANKSLSAGTLTNPKRLFGVLNASTKSLTTDDDLNTGRMIKIAQGMQSLTAGKLRFVTVPFAPYAPDPNRVALRQPVADQFFTSLRNDKEVRQEPKTNGKLDPSKVQLRVLNATGMAGQARRVADALEAQGFRVSSVGNVGTRASTQVLYGPGLEAQANTLADVIPGASKTPRQGGAPGIVDLVIGSNFTSVKAKNTGIPTQQGEIRADGNICKEA